MSSNSSNSDIKFPTIRRVYASTIPSELVDCIHETPAQKSERLRVIKRKERENKIKEMFGE